MATSANFKRLFLRGLQWDAQDKGITLSECLKLAARARLTDTQSGRVLLATAGNGHSVTFATPTGSYFTQQDAAELCEDLLLRFDRAQTYLQAGTSETQPGVEVTAPTEDEIFAEMIQRIRPVTSVRNDYSSLRTAA